MFIRIKKIKGNSYAYLVDCKWYKRKLKGKNKDLTRGRGAERGRGVARGKGPRQKVVKYLGRVFSFEIVNEVDFFTYHKILEDTEFLKKAPKIKLIRLLVEWEFFRNGISKEDFEVYYQTGKILRKGNNCCIKMNEGYLCSYTFRNLLKFKFSGDQRLDGFNYAKAFVDAGISVPKEVFVELFSRGQN